MADTKALKPDLDKFQITYNSLKEIADVIYEENPPAWDPFR